MHLRAATHQDEDALSRIDAATWSTAVTPSPAPAPGGTFFRTKRQPDEVIVADIDGSVVGYVHVGREIPFASAEHVMTVRGLAVDPAHQRSGVGRALLDAAVEMAARQGARKLKSRVLSSNPASLALHARCGFVVEGTRIDEFLLDGAFVDDVLLARHELQLLVEPELVERS